MVFMEHGGRMMMKSGRRRTGGRKMIFVEQSERSLIWSRLQRRSEHLSAEMFSFYIKSIINTTTCYFSLHFRYRTGQTENKLYKIYCFITFITWKISNFIVLSVWIDFAINVFKYLLVYYRYLVFKDTSYLKKSVNLFYKNPQIKLWTWTFKVSCQKVLNSHTWGKTYR